MEFWIWFWTIFLFSSLAVFAGLAVIITLGGIPDIAALFRKIKN